MNGNPEAAPPRPLVGVSVLVRNKGHTLLVKRGRSPFAGLWSLPGGRVEWGEGLEDAAIREVLEETDVKIDSLRRIDLAEIIGRDPTSEMEFHIVLVVFAGRFHSGSIMAGDDAAEARWVAPEDLSELDMTTDTRRMIEMHGLSA